MKLERLGLVRLSAMGDVVQSLGAAAALRRARPDLQIHFVTQRGFEPLCAGLGFDSVVGHERRGGLRAALRTRRVLRDLSLDAVVDLQGNWKSALACRLSSARVRLGAAAAQRQEPRSAWLLDQRVVIGGPRHPAWIALRLLDRLVPGLEVRRPVLVASAAEVGAAAADVAAVGIDSSRSFTVFVAGAESDPRAWRRAAMQRQQILEPNPVLWLTGPDERDLAVPSGAAHLHQASGSLRQLVGLGALVRAVGGRVVGPDLGATHVLAGCGAATTVLFGPQDPSRTAPPGSRVVRRRDGPDCMPCRRRRCAHPDGPVCMDVTTLS